MVWEVRAHRVANLMFSLSCIQLQDMDTQQIQIPQKDKQQKFKWQKSKYSST